ncbi:CbtB domain-containing protein [Sneathiella limimaris]|uniref:CbtB domain-containing protein n=1 Tax=Sneathiella limimaris TaxID=1964213 RepID=UPI00146A4DC7|nr:CbtB domain-containing protein [Sneathiella limimaris]
MTAQTTTLSASKSKLAPILFSAMMGLALVFVAGHIQANTLHDAAHDVRHATGFPCH